MSENPPIVVVFGSLHYDIIVASPARPRKGETIAGRSWQPKCGGKGGNQAVAAAGAGMRSAMIGAVAEDDFGRTLLDNLAARGVDRRFVRANSDAPTGMSVAIVDSEGDYGAVIVSGSNLTLADADVESAQELFAPANILVLQNEVPDSANQLAAAAMKAAGGLVILNAAPARIPSGALAAKIDILVVNAVEAELLAGVPVVDSLEGGLAAARILSRSYPTSVVTVGDKGVACVTAGGAEITIDAIPVELVSTHGAGDEFIGVLAASLARGEAIAEALARANRAAAELVSRPAS